MMRRIKQLAKKHWPLVRRWMLVLVFLATVSAALCVLRLSGEGGAASILFGIASILFFLICLQIFLWTRAVFRKEMAKRNEAAKGRKEVG